MSGLYSPINRAAELINRPKGTGAEYMAELQKKPGYKPAEAEDRDLQALMALPQMERAAFMEKLQAQKNKFPLKHRELTGTQTHHGDYTMPGGENYREILLHTPMPEGQGFEGRSHHFGGMPNILASIRVKDRTTPEGKKMLHLEEIQSDWHQQGRESGYHPKDLDKQLKEVAQWKKRLEKTQFLGMDKYEYAEHMKALEDAEEEQNKLEQLKEEGVPYGPHSKDWHELALKAMIQHAAENGYDQLGITPGAEQAKRFSLSKHVGSVSYDPINRHFQAFKPNRETIANEKGATPERIQALIGKEATEKLLQAPKTMGHHYLEGENLDIGGEGMKGFYDRMVPSFLNKFGKKHGVQVQQAELSQPQIANRNKLLSQFGEEGSAVPQPKLHTFDITPAMREDILKNGIPRYDEGGIIHKAEGGSMQEPSVHQMRSALMGHPNITSLSNLTSVGANEAPGLPVKTFIPPHGAETNGSIPVGGVDENVMQPGQQLMPQQPQQAAPQSQAGAQPQQGQPQPPQGPQSNILSMTPQGQAMAAMRPAGMASGGGVEHHPSLEMMRSILANKFSPPATKASEALGQHEGKTLKVTQSDRTKVGGGFLGGAGFSALQHVNPEYEGAAWAVGKPAAASKLVNASGPDVLWSTLIGNPHQHTSNQMVFDLLLNEFKAAIKAGKMTPELRDSINARLAAALGEDKQPLFDNPNIAGKNFFKNLSTFDQRRVMANLMGGAGVGGKKGQLFDYDKIVHETTDPELRGAPTHAIGPRLFSLTGERSHQPDLHPAFPHILHGEDLGQVYHPVPSDVMLPDFHEHIQKTKGRKPGVMDLTRNTPSQFISEKFLTGLQKQGHKKGGGVKLHTDQDTMALELSRKKKVK
jgi:hypothetical protein